MGYAKAICIVLKGGIGYLTVMSYIQHYIRKVVSILCLINILFIVIISGCSAIHRVNHYKVNVEGQDLLVDGYEEGVSFTNEFLCIWADEA